MLETKDLILDKAKPSDWKAMYENVWSHPQAAKYMLWDVTTNETDAQQRIQRTIDFQKVHDTYLVYEKATGDAIGFAGVEPVEADVWEEAGICLGPKFVGKGYGKQILLCLIQYCQETHRAKQFLYSTRAENEASKALAASFGFEEIAQEEKTDPRNGKQYTFLRYRLRL